VSDIVKLNLFESYVYSNSYVCYWFSRPKPETDLWT